MKVGMCEGGPPSLSLGRLAELSPSPRLRRTRWRVIKMCECCPTSSRDCGTTKGARDGRFWIGKRRGGE